MAEERRSILDYQSPRTMLGQLNDNFKPPEETDPSSIGEVWEAARYRQWIGSAALRQSELQDPTEIEEGYSVSMDTLKQYNNKGYSDVELEFLSDSTSQANFVRREEQIKADREAKRVIDNSGVLGFATEMVASVFDPTMIPAMFANAPVTVTAKTTRTGRIVASMLEGAAWGAGTEYALMQGDTQRTNQDLFISTVGGMTFSGLLEIGRLGLRDARVTLDNANKVESDYRDSFNGLEHGDAYSKADTTIQADIPSAPERKRVLSEKDIVRQLQEEVGERVEVLSPKKVKQLKKDFAEYRKGREAVIKSIESRPNLRPKARASEVKQVTDAIARRKQELDDIIEANRLSLASNSQVDALQQGKVPDSLLERYREIKAESGEFDVSTSPKLGDDVKYTKPPKVDDLETEKVQSVGAMRTRTEFDDIQTWDELLTETDISEVKSALHSAEQLGMELPRNNRMGEVVKPVRSLYTEIDSAPDATTRGLNAMLIKNPQRTTQGLQSAEELAETLFFRAVPDYLDYQNAFDAYLKQNGIGKFNLSARTKAEQEFDRQTVYMQASGNLLSNKPVEGDSAIMLGAKARSRLYEQGLKNNKDYGVIGFEKIKHRHEYHSVVFDQDNIRRMVGEHADFIYDAIASAYQTGAIKVSRENAVRLAENQVARAMAVKGANNKAFDRFMSDAEFKRLSDELEEQGVDKEVIADIKESIFNEEMRGEISPRAMFSLRPNMKARSGDVWFIDLLDTSINRNMKYVSDSAANAGLASNGFHSRHQFQRAVISARDEAINNLRNDVDHFPEGSKARKQAEKALADVVEGRYSKKLDEALRLIYREPLEDGDGLKDVTRLLRKATSVVRLRTTGLATLPEAATSAIRNGIFNTMKQIPATRWFDFRKQSVAKDEFMLNFSRTFSATGHQEYLFGKSFYNGSDFDDVTKNSLQRIDKNLGHALDITMTVNGFKTFQHGGEEMTARAIVNNLRDLADKGEITSNVRRSLIDVGGMSEAQIDEMITVFKANPNMDIFDSVRTMTPELHNSLSTAVRNTIGHSYMRMTIGEQPAYMNKEMGKIMTTLMSFTIGSYEKMLLRGIKNERAILLSIIAGQAMLGYGALVANTYIQAQGMSGSKREKYIQSKLDDEGAFWGTTARVGVFAAPLVPLQVLNTLGALPEEMKGVGRMGGVQSSALVADAMSATSAGVQLATKNQTKREEEQDWNAIKRVLPWYNSTVYNLTVGSATND